ncbi:MAG: DUF5668 domain-containing protein [Siphonobacter sp.]
MNSINTKNVLLGGFLVVLGILFLGRNMGWFDFHFHEIARFWPLLFVVIGVNYIWGKSNQAINVIAIILLAICIPLIIASKVKGHFRDGDRFDRDHFSFRYNDDNDADQHDSDDEEDDDSFGSEGGKQYLAEPMNANTKVATFHMEGGAAHFTLGTSNQQLAEADGDLGFGSLSLKTTSTTDGNSDVLLKMKGKGRWNFGDNDHHNEVAVRLNPGPDWNLDLQIGAGEVDFDLTPFKVKKIDLQTGAADLDLKLGDKADNTDINIESGVASIKIKVPEGVGCRITTDGALTDKKFDGFSHNGDTYETSNYGSAQKKINIHFQGGMAEWKVERY